MLKYIRCRNCNRTFILSEGEQIAYTTNGMPLPTICSTCRKERRAINEIQAVQQADRQDKEDNEIREAFERLFGEPSAKPLLEDMLIVRKVIGSAMELRERNTTVKAPDIRGIRAAQAFEQFIKEHFPEVTHYIRIYSDVSETINYYLSLPQPYSEKLCAENAAIELDRILREAEAIDYSIEKDDPKMKGTVHLSVSFLAVIRVYKDNEKNT